MNTTQRKLFFGPSLAALLLAGCMVGPKYHQPAATVQPPPAAYKELPVENPPAGEWKVAQPQDAMLHGKWWRFTATRTQRPKTSSTSTAEHKGYRSHHGSPHHHHSGPRATLSTLGTTPSFQRSQSCQPENKASARPAPPAVESQKPTS
jgi:hypothetical protein